MLTHLGQGIFQAKATVFRARRFLQDITPNSGLQPWPASHDEDGGRLLATSRSPLWDVRAPAAERVLQAGKVQNLRIASQRLDRCTVPANGIFSFWRQVGCPTRFHGYVKGRELRQSCLIPSIAGGLCQLSNALYEGALQAGFTIHERHAHTQVVPGSAAESGRDATVFWNYVDLRYSSQKGFRIRVDLTPDELVVEHWSLA